MIEHESISSGMPVDGTVETASVGAQPEIAIVETPKLFTGARMESNEKYHSEKLYVNASSLKNMDVSPMHYKHMLTQTVEKTDSMILGSVVHCMMLEDKKAFDDNFAIVPKVDKRSKEGKLRWQIFEIQNKNKELVTDEMYAVGKAMFEAAMKKKTVRELIAEGDKEKSYYWYDEERKMYCRIKPDFAGLNNRRFIADLKTANDVSPEGFSKICAKLRYDVQAGFYPKGLKSVLGIEYPEFLFIAIQNTPPHDVVVYDCTNDFMLLADYHANYLLDKVAACREANEWKGVDEKAFNEYGIMGLDLPKWYQQQINYQTYV